MKRIYLFLILSSVLLSFSSCQKEELLRDESVVTSQAVYQNDLDKWIYTNITKPYNIEVKYKWDANEITSKFHVAPPRLEKVKEFLDAYLNLWIKPYEEESKANGNPEFIFKLVPKLLVLVGTPAYNEDGTATMGLAEGGRKVTIFDIDNFGVAYDASSWDSPETALAKRREAVLASFHVLHHEFCHILNQTKFYPNEFKDLNKADYTARWMDVEEANANIKGCITPYAMSNENEDFAEVASGMLDRVKFSNVPHVYEDEPLMDSNGDVSTTNGNLTMSAWEFYLYKFSMDYKIDYTTWSIVWFRTPEAKAGFEKMKAKVNIVTTYYKEKWGIDIYNMQKRIETGVNDLIK